MEELLQQTIDTAAASAAVAAGELTTTSTANGVVFLLISALGLLMALVYVPIRVFLTVTARSRRLRLLQRIRRLRDDLAQPVAPAPGEDTPPLETGAIGLGERSGVG